MVEKVGKMDKTDLGRIRAISEETGVPENAVLKWLIHQKYFELFEDISPKEPSPIGELK